MKLMSFSRKYSGFTLIEVMLMIALVFLVALFASPFSGTFFFTQERSITYDEIRGSLEKARLYSMTGKNGSAWGVTAVGQKIVLFQGDGYSNLDAPGNEIYDIRGRVTVTGFSEVVFDRITGNPRTTPTITISDDFGSESATLNSEGVFERQ